MNCIGLLDPRERWEALRGANGPVGVAAAGKISDATAAKEKELSFQMPAAPPPFKERSALDLEGLCYLMKQSMDTSLETAANESSAQMDKRSAAAHAEKKKADEARVAAADRGFWDSVTSAFSWIAEAIGATVAIAAAVVSGGTLAIVIAAAAVLNTVLEHSKAYEHMDDFGKALSGALSTLAAAGNWGSLAFTATSQTLEKSGGLALLARESGALAGVLQASLLASSVASSVFWTSANAVSGIGEPLSELHKTIATVAKIMAGAAQVAAGSGQVMSTLKRHDVEVAGIEAKQFRIAADKIHKCIEDLMDAMEEQRARGSRAIGMAVEVQEGRHTVAMALAASVRA